VGWPHDPLYFNSPALHGAASLWSPHREPYERGGHLMHRRRYIPGSHIKISRAELAQINRALAKKAEHLAGVAADARKGQREAQAQTFAAKTRSFVEGVKRVFTTPIRLRRRSA